MAGLDPAIHVLMNGEAPPFLDRLWPGMTSN
jgi:hypothetical protein